MKLGYLLIAVSFAANANCRVANNDIVCDNSNTLIETYNTLIRPQQLPVNVFVVNQPVVMPEIINNYNFDLLDERVFEVRERRK